MNKIPIYWEALVRNWLMQLFRITLLPFWFVYHFINEILNDIYGDEK